MTGAKSPFELMYCKKWWYELPQGRITHRLARLSGEVGR